MIAPVVAGLLWRFLLIDNFGIVNQLLFEWGLIESPDQIQWLSDPDIALFSVALPDIWLTTSFITLVLFAGLQNIPGDVVEAARIDGANYWRLLVSVIIPLLRPVIAVALIVRGIDAARASTSSSSRRMAARRAARPRSACSSTARSPASATRGSRARWARCTSSRCWRSRSPRSH